MNFKSRIGNTTFFKTLFSFFFFLVSFTYIFKFIQPHLIYHASQTAFLATPVFFEEFTDIPGRLIFYLSSFIAQSLYYELLGSIVLVTLCFGIFLSGCSILKKFLPWHLSYLVMFIPIICLLSLLNNYSFPFVLLIDTLFLFLAVRISLALLNTKLSVFLIYPVISMPLYYISGSSAFMVFSLSFILILVLKYRFHLAIPIIVLTMVILPYVVFKLFNVTLKEAYFYLFPEQLTVILNKHIIPFYISYLILPASLILLIFKDIFSKAKPQSETKKDIKDANKNKLRTPILLYICSSLIIITGAIYILKTRDVMSKKIVEADYFCEAGNWDKVIEVSLSAKEYNLSINYCYNRAIRNNGHFLDMFFHYQQKMGVVSLFPDIINSGRTAMMCSDINFDLGNICQAHHWAHEAQSSNLFNPNILKRLVLTNLILGNYKAADKLLTLLSESFHNENFIRTFKPLTADTNLIAANTIINEKRKLMPKNKVIPGDLIERLQELLYANGNNRMAYEHLQMCYLLNYELDNFIKYLPYGQYYYKNLPEIFEEALLLYFNSYGINAADKYGISKDSQERFQGINKIISDYNGDKNAAQPLIAKYYRNTYLYYVLYLMPDLSDETIKTLKNNQN